MVGETRSCDTTVYSTIPQYHAHAAAVVRGLALAVAAPAHIGRVVAGGCVQYFGTFYSPGSGFTTAPLCDEIRLLGLACGDRRATLHLLARWEEASAWLAEQMERRLARVVFAAAAEPCAVLTGDDDSCLSSDAAMAREATVVTTTAASGCPGWWVNPCESGVLLWELERSAYRFERTVKVSVTSTVMLARCRSSGVEVVLKLYENRPAQLMDTLNWLHSPAIKKRWVDVGDVVEVLDEFVTTIGHVVVFTKLGNRVPIRQSATSAVVATRLRELLASLHELGIVHGDVHAGNVAWNSTTCRVGLFDFDECCTSSGLPQAEWLQRQQLEMNSIASRCKFI